MTASFLFQDIDTHSVVDRMTHAHGHEILRLPPYHSALLNPIEQMWAFCKNYVAVNNTRQTMSTVSISLQRGSVDSTLGLSTKTLIVNYYSAYYKISILKIK